MAPSFATLTTDAKRVVVIDLGFLGDTIHLLPALWIIRQQYKNAELHVMVAEHITGLLECTPWVDKVWGYPRFPKGPKWYQDLGRIGRLRDAQFDVAINLNGSDRSSFLTFFSGAKWRLGRCTKSTLKRRLLFTHLVVHPRHQDLISNQHCQVLEKAGFQNCGPEFHITLPPNAVESVTQRVGHNPLDGRKWIHVSPFTTQDHKELPIEILCAGLNEVHQAKPEIPIVISCAANQREQSKLNTLLGGLRFEPDRVFSGTLSLLELAAVLRGSLVHLGGDSGGLHVAVMNETPTISWFRRYEGAVEWLPRGAKDRVLLGNESPSGLVGIQSADLLKAVLEVLR